MNVHLLTVVFVILKLVGVIHWSWWLVLLPTWLSFAVAGILFALVGAYVIAEAASKK